MDVTVITNPSGTSMILAIFTLVISLSILGIVIYLIFLFIKGLRIYIKKNS